MKITVKDAVGRANKYLREVFPDVVDPQLEEVEFLDAENVWNVTLSYLRPIPLEAGTLSPVDVATKAYWQIIGGKKYERVYKLISVEAGSGECQSIKIRQLQ